MKNSYYDWYINESPLSKYFIPTGLFIISILFNSLIIKGCIAISKLIFEDFEVNFFVNLLCILIVIGGLVKIIYNLSKRRILTLLSAYWCFLIILIYMLIFRRSEHFIFYKTYFTQIYVIDCCIWGSLIFFSSYVYIGRRWGNSVESSLIEDIPESVNKDNDKLFRYTYAEHVANLIDNANAQKAVAIAITSEWGYGKTTFLRFIEDHLKLKKNNNDSRNIIIHFNPWKFEKSGQILSHFFESLESEFEKFDDQSAARIKDYSDKLTEVDDSTITKLIKQSVTTIIGGDKTLSDRYDSLNNAIERSGKRIIVIMDDLDRLVPDELITLVRLIRNTADFKNTFFLTAFDQNYVLNALSDARHKTNKENFLQKVFQLEITLPPIGKGVINSVFKEYLSLDLMPLEEKSQFEGVLVSGNKTANNDYVYVNFFSNDENANFSPRIDVEHYLRNIRDVKRFINSFKLAYSIIGSEVDLYDLMLVELIKYRFPSIYTMLAEKEIVDQLILLKSTWQVSDETLDKHLKQENLQDLNISISDTDLIKSTLKDLFNKNRSRSDRSIINQSNFHLYFQYQLLESISVKEFNTARRSGRQALELYFTKLINEGKYDQLLSYLDLIISYDSTEEFENIIHCLISKSNGYDDSIRHAAVLLGKKDFNISTYYNSDASLYDSYVEGLLRDTNYKISNRAQIAHEFMLLHLRDQNPKILTLELLQNILFYLFNRAIEDQSESELTVYQLYTYTSSRIENKRHVMDTRANHLFREYLENNNKNFLKNIIYSPMTPNFDNQYKFNDFIPQIFGSYELFKSYLNNLPESVCKSYLLTKFEEYKLNHYEFITIENLEAQNPCKDAN